MASSIKDQIDAVRREMPFWPEWRRHEIEAEVLKTPKRKDAPVRRLSLWGD